MYPSHQERSSEYEHVIRWRKALTAIALLFAIQNLKPSPFCLLDEIEAALDDSNVGRYANYLHKLTKHTQFIVITHRRGTMAAADRLYGITMQEKGVSTLVSVDLIANDLNEPKEKEELIWELFSKLKEGLTRPEIISYRALIIYLMAFLQLMMISTKNLKRLLLWEILVSGQLMRLLKTLRLRLKRIK